MGVERMRRGGDHPLELSVPAMRELVDQATARIVRHVESLPRQPAAYLGGGEELARSVYDVITRILRPMARSATIEPILPQPMMPSVLAVISTPMKRFFSHLPAWVEASAAGS